MCANVFVYYQLGWFTKASNYCYVIRIMNTIYHMLFIICFNIICKGYEHHNVSNYCLALYYNAWII